MRLLLETEKMSRKEGGLFAIISLSLITPFHYYYYYYSYISPLDWLCLLIFINLIISLRYAYLPSFPILFLFVNISSQTFWQYKRRIIKSFFPSSFVSFCCLLFKKCSSLFFVHIFCLPEPKSANKNLCFNLLKKKEKNFVVVKKSR